MDSVSSLYLPQHGRAPGTRRAAIAVATIGVMLLICESPAWLVRQIRPTR